MLESQNLELKIFAELKILVGENAEFKILESQNPE